MRSRAHVALAPEVVDEPHQPFHETFAGVSLGALEEGGNLILDALQFVTLGLVILPHKADGMLVGLQVRVPGFLGRVLEDDVTCSAAEPWS